MTPDTPMPVEKLEEILKGLEGVTPGPWFAQDVSLMPDDVGSSYIVGENLGGLVGAAHAWPTEIDEGDFERVEANAAHIARCDPDTVRSIITELLALRPAATQKLEVAEGHWSDPKTFEQDTLVPAPQVTVSEAPQRFAIEHDGFVGTVIGHYTRLDGKRGVVMQQDGTNVVHVYGEKWLKPAAALSGKAGG